MARYKVLAGGYQDADLKDYKRGDIVESERDLVDAFGPSLFKLVGEAPPAPPAKPKAPKVPMGKKQDPPAEDTTPAEDPASPDDDVKPEGKEMTRFFPKAVDNDFVVYKRGKEYFLYDTDDMTKPVNEKGLPKKVQINELITKQLDS